MDEAKAPVVRRVFGLAIKGHGIGPIAKVLNREVAPCISKSRTWRDSFVYKVLTNRACIGGPQLHILKDGEFVPVGQPLKNYYPAVVKEATFYRAQQALKDRSSTGRRCSDKVSNLFAGLVVDDTGATYGLRARNGHD